MGRVSENLSYEIMDSLATPWDVYLNECGYSTLANFITLAYRTPHPVNFSISGRALWKYQITARSPKADWHANKSLLCARNKEKGFS